MALVKTVILGAGITLPNAYYRISTVGGDKYAQILTTCLYASQDDYENLKDCLEQKYFTFAPLVTEGSDNFIKQGYEHLKTLEEFSSAIDA